MRGMNGLISVKRCSPAYRRGGFFKAGGLSSCPSGRGYGISRRRGCRDGRTERAAARAPSGASYWGWSVRNEGGTVLYNGQDIYSGEAKSFRNSAGMSRLCSRTSRAR
jgi:hypothetical protein